MSWMKMSATNRTTPTTAIVEYWRLRYARAPSCTADEIETIFSLPGQRAVDQRAGCADERDDDAVVTQEAGQDWILRGFPSLNIRRARKRSGMLRGPAPATTGGLGPLRTARVYRGRRQIEASPPARR